MYLLYIWCFSSWKPEETPGGTTWRPVFSSGVFFSAAWESGPQNLQHHRRLCLEEGSSYQHSYHSYHSYQHVSICCRMRRLMLGIVSLTSLVSVWTSPKQRSMCKKRAVEAAASHLSFCGCWYICPAGRRLAKSKAEDETQWSEPSPWAQHLPTRFSYKNQIKRNMPCFKTMMF